MEKERKGRQQAEEKNIELTRKVTTGEGEGRRREGEGRRREEEGGGGRRRGEERGGRSRGEERREEVSTACNGCT